MNQTNAIATTRRDELAVQYRSLSTFLEGRKKQFAALAGKTLDTERCLKLLLDAAGRNPQLLECTPESVLQTFLFCGKVGLEPCGAWGVHPVPFKNKNKGGRLECTPIVDYRGLIALVTRTGNVTSVRARVVYEADHFDLEFGDEEHIHHRPAMVEATKRGKMVGVYSIATLASGEKQREFLPRAEVDRYRAKSRASSGPWTTDYDAMAKKTAIRRICNLLPIPFETQASIGESDAAEFGDDALPSLEQDTTIEVEGEATEAEVVSAPAQLPSSRTEALKQELRAQPVAAPAQRQSAPPPPPPTTTEAPTPATSVPPDTLPASGAEDSPGEVQALKAKLTSLGAELAGLIGQRRAELVWKGSRGVGSMRGATTVKSLQERLERAQGLLEVAQLELDVKSARNELLELLGDGAADQLAQRVPNASKDLFAIDAKDAHKVLADLFAWRDELAGSRTTVVRDEAQVPWDDDHSNAVDDEPGSDG